MKIERNGVVYRGAAAKFISETPEHELMYLDIVNEVTDQLYSFMEKQGMTKADLARILGKSRASVSQTLAGETNFTLKTIAKYLTALNGELCLKIIPKEQKKFWDVHFRPLKASHKANRAQDIYRNPFYTKQERAISSPTEGRCIEERKKIALAAA